MICKYLEYIGLRNWKESSNPTASQPTNYSPVGAKDIAILYLDYLKDLRDYHQSRLQNIENKNSQLLSQVSIVVSIVALFIPFLGDSVSEFAFLIKVFFVVLFLCVLFHYTISILHATKTLEINNFAYVTGSTKTVYKTGRKEIELDWLNEEINDLIIAIDRNKIINNKKGSNLVYGSRCFKIANISFVIVSIFVIISSTFIPKKDNTITVKNLNDSSFVIKNILRDTVKTGVINDINEQLKEMRSEIHTLQQTIDTLIVPTPPDTLY